MADDAVTTTVAADAAPAAPAPEQAVVAPVVEPAAAEPVQQTVQDRYRSKSEAHKAAVQTARERAAALTAQQESATLLEQQLAEAAPAPDTAAEPVVDAQGRKHDPATGKFIEGEVQQDAARDAGGETSPAAAAPPQGEATTAATAAATPQPVKVPIPQDHPIREMGLDALEASSPQQERAIRALVNSYTRRQQVEEAEQRAVTAERELIRVRAEQSAVSKWKATPEYQTAAEKYHEIADSVGQDAADRYWRDVQNDWKQLAEQEYEQQITTAEAAEIERAYNVWKGEAWQRAARIPEHIRQMPDFGRWFNTAVETFDFEVQRGSYPHLQPGDTEALHTEFERFFAARVRSQPPVQQLSQQQAAARTREQVARNEAERKRIADDAARNAVEEARRKAAETRQQQPPHPLGRVATAPAPAAAVQQATTTDDRNLSPHEIQRRAREAARAAGRAFAQNR
jgi:hypothetical protein